jgi:hypothetical protein
MMIKALILLLMIISFSINTVCLAQHADSIRVYIQGAGYKGEKYKVYHKGNLLLKFKSNGFYSYNFSILKGINWKYGTPINIYIERKGVLGFRYRSIDLNAFYDGKSKYYVLKRNSRLKNKYAFEYFWFDEPPILVD